MEMNSASVEAVVKQVLESMLEGKPAVKAPVAKANTGSNMTAQRKSDLGNTSFFFVAVRCRSNTKSTHPISAATAS